MAERKTRAELASDAGAPFTTGKRPSQADLQDLVESCFNLLDDDTADVLADGVTDALWAAYYPALLPDPATNRFRLDTLLNRLLTDTWTNRPRVVASVAELRDLDHTQHSMVFTSGVLSAGDGGAQGWVWDEASTDADDVGATVAESGWASAGRWKALRADNTVNVKLFGALGADVDYTDEIDAALAFLHTLGGGVLFFPVGSYGYTGTLLMWDVTTDGPNRVSLVGEHSGMSLLGGTEDQDKGHCTWLDITPTGSAGPCIKYIGANDPLTSRGGRFQIRDMVIRGNGAYVESVIYIEDATDPWRLENLNIIAPSESPDAHGIWANNSWGGQFTQVKCIHKGGVTTTDDLKIPNDQTGYGIWIDNEIGGGDGGAINMTILENCRTNSWHAGVVWGNSGLSDHINSNVMLGGAIQYCDTGIIIGGGEGIEIIGTHIEHTNVAAIHVGDADGSANIAIRGGKWHQISGAGLLIAGAGANNVTLSNIYCTNLYSNTSFIDIQDSSGYFHVEMCRAARKSGATGIYFLETDSGIFSSENIIYGICNRIGSTITLTNRPEAVRYLTPQGSVNVTTLSGTDIDLDVTDRSVVAMNNAGGITIRSFTGGTPGQIVRVIAGNAQTIGFLHAASGGNLRTNTGATVTLTQNQGTTFVFPESEDKWYQV